MSILDNKKQKFHVLIEKEIIVEAYDYRDAATLAMTQGDPVSVAFFEDIDEDTSKFHYYEVAGFCDGCGRLIMQEDFNLEDPPVMYNDNSEDSILCSECKNDDLE